MANGEGIAGRIELREVVVHPVRDAQERRRWDALVSEFHCLPFHGRFGQSLRHVAVHGSRWVALVGWTAARSRSGRGTGGSAGVDRQQQPLRGAGWQGEVPGLASRVLGLSLRRQSRDMRAAHGRAVLVAETFVNTSRFAGACYRASNWRMLGVTRGFTRLPGGSAAGRGANRPEYCRDEPTLRGQRNPHATLPHAGGRSRLRGDRRRFHGHRDVANERFGLAIKNSSVDSVTCALFDSHP